MKERYYRPEDGGFPLRLQLNDKFVLANKPPGMPTHAPATGREGLCEYLSRRLGEKLYVIHRLDNDTSGAIIFARSREAAAAAGRAIENNEYQKEYFFVSDRMSGQTEFVIDSPLRRKGNRVVVDVEEGDSCSTSFCLEKQSGKYSLWKAVPIQGRMHQIRAHAQIGGVSIVGDTLYGGTKGQRVCLHSRSFTITEVVPEAHISPLPYWMEDLSLFEHSVLLNWIFIAEKRLTLYMPDASEAMRLVGTEDSGIRIDKMGERLVVSVYPETGMEDNLVPAIKEFSRQLEVPGWYIRYMYNRGKNPQLRNVTESDSDTSWTISEHGIKYILYSDRGLSPGIFLDQRRNRFLIKQIARNRRVLNLFCYTAGFGLCAASGGASEVVNVDTSRQTLQWAKENFEGNSFTSCGVDYRMADARYYINRAKKHQNIFDIIILDPPSFSRGKKELFRVEKDLGPLVRECWDILATAGYLLITTNYEQWDQESFFQRMKNSLPPEARFEELPLPEYDVRDSADPPLLKGIIVRKS